MEKNYRKKPEEIDFSDPSEDEPLKIEDLDGKLNNIINERKILVSNYENVEIKKQFCDIILDVAIQMI